jgi:uncharacterized membrane protein
MRKSRLEAFTDGVMAIVITLLILDVKLPEVEYGGLAGGLIAILPKISVYTQSFLLIGLYWVFHHQAFSFINEVDGVLLWINVLFLLLISFLPFPTAMMGKYHYQTLPLIIYCANIMLVNLTGFIMLFYLRRNPQLASPLFTDRAFRTQLKTYISVNAVYALCIVLAFIVPVYSSYLLGILALFLVFRSVLQMGIGKCAI